MSVDDLYQPEDDGKESKIFISKSYNATTDFTTVSDDIKDLYERIFGEEFNFDVVEGSIEG